MKTQTFKPIFLLFILCSCFAFSQITISGKVTFRNKGIKDVSVTLRDTYDGATTNEQGFFSFSTSEKGPQTVVFTHPKYDEISKNILIENANLDVNCELIEQISEIDAVVISVGSIEASDKKRATTLLSPIDIYTTAGANGQVSSALETLPGVQKVGESEGLFVRGGTGTETKFFMDGNLVNNYFGNSIPGIKAMDRLNTSLFKGNVFSSGGYSAVYGQALSSVLVLESIDLPERNSADFGISPIFVSGGIQRVNTERTYSYGVTTGYSHLGLMQKIMKFNTNFEKAPQGFDINANFRIKTKNGGFIKYYGSYDISSMKVLSENLDNDFLKNRINQKGDNTFHSLSYREKIGKNTLNLGTSYTYNHNNMFFDTLNGNASVFSNNIDTKANYFNAKAMWERKIFKISAFRAGAEINTAKETTALSMLNQPAVFKDQISSVFGETDLGLNNNLSIKIGARAEHSSAINKWNIAPRFAMAYRISKEWTSSVAYGSFYQNPESRFFNPNYNPDYQKADHYIAQLQRNADGRSLRMEAYYKKYDALLKTDNNMFFQKAINNNGNGFAKGIELFWRDKKSIKDIDYWVSYSFLDSKRDYLNYTEALFPNFAAKHTVSLVAKKFVTDWKTGFNISYNYNSGRPYYNFVEENGKVILKNQGFVKDYNALNFSVNYLPNLGKKDAKAFTVLVLSINNVLGTKNIFGYNFSSDGTKSSAIRPPSDTFVFIGAFISFGTDRTEEAINNNL